LLFWLFFFFGGIFLLLTLCFFFFSILCFLFCRCRFFVLTACCLFIACLLVVALFLHFVPRVRGVDLLRDQSPCVTTVILGFRDYWTCFFALCPILRPCLFYTCVGPLWRVFWLRPCWGCVFYRYRCFFGSVFFILHLFFSRVFFVVAMSFSIGASLCLWAPCLVCMSFFFCGLCFVRSRFVFFCPLICFGWFFCLWPFGDYLIFCPGPFPDCRVFSGASLTLSFFYFRCSCSGDWFVVPLCANMLDYTFCACAGLRSVLVIHLVAMYCCFGIVPGFQFPCSLTPYLCYGLCCDVPWCRPLLCFFLGGIP